MNFDKGGHISKKTYFYTKPDYFSYMAKFSNTDPGTLPNLRWSSLQQLVTVESCKGLFLINHKVSGRAPDLYVSHHYMQ